MTRAGTFWASTTGSSFGASAAATRCSRRGFIARGAGAVAAPGAEGGTRGGLTVEVRFAVDVGAGFDVEGVFGGGAADAAVSSRARASWRSRSTRAACTRSANRMAGSEIAAAIAQAVAPISARRPSLSSLALRRMRSTRPFACAFCGSSASTRPNAASAAEVRLRDSSSSPRARHRSTSRARTRGPSSSGSRTNRASISSGCSRPASASSASSSWRSSVAVW